MIRSFAAAACLAVLLFAGTATASDAPDPRQTWQLLDYIAVDYRGAVKDGQATSESEYEEMREFAATARAQLEALPDNPERPALLAGAEALIKAVEAKRPADDVARIAHDLADALLVAYRVPVAPTAAPNLARGKELFAAQCSACHGAVGAGDGPAAKDMDPPPVAFTDRARARERSPFSYYQVITHGIAGTPMAAFADLSDSDRWALAFYTGTLAFSDAERTAGERRWRDDGAARAAFPNLEAVTRTTEEAVAAKLADAGPVLAYLRSHPEALVSGGHTLTMARQRLAESVAAYEAGRTADAQRLALSAYLDGFEPVEPTLAAIEPDLLKQVETAMGQYRTALGSGAPAADVQARAHAIETLFERVDLVLSQGEASPGAAFLGSFTILAREGVEALLIIVAILAFLRKADRTDVARYVHAGWIGALVAGAFTWAAATSVITVSGASREVTEGASSLFAAAVLLSVGLWMHNKSVAGRWQEYLHAKLSRAMSQRSAWFLAGLAFIATYREVFETILFYAALWTQGQHQAILLGLAAAALALAAVAYALLRLTMRLPIGQFFSATSILVGVLAVVLAGKGVAALQEAGLIDLHMIDGPRIDVLGIYPNIEVLFAQLAVVALTIVGLAYNWLRVSRPAAK